MVVLLRRKGWWQGAAMADLAGRCRMPRSVEAREGTGWFEGWGEGATGREIRRDGSEADGWAGRADVVIRREGTEADAERASEKARGWSRRLRGRWEKRARGRS